MSRNIFYPVSYYNVIIPQGNVDLYFNETQIIKSQKKTIMDVLMFVIHLV